MPASEVNLGGGGFVKSRKNRKRKKSIVNGPHRTGSITVIVPRPLAHSHSSRRLVHKIISTTCLSQRAPCLLQENRRHSRRNNDDTSATTLSHLSLLFSSRSLEAEARRPTHVRRAHLLWVLRVLLLGGPSPDPAVDCHVHRQQWLVSTHVCALPQFKTSALDILQAHRASHRATSHRRHRRHRDAAPPPIVSPLTTHHPPPTTHHANPRTGTTLARGCSSSFSSPTFATM